MGSCQYGSLRCVSRSSLPAFAYLQQFPSFRGAIRPTIPGAADTAKSAFPICCDPEVDSESKVRAANAANLTQDRRCVKNLAALSTPGSAAQTTRRYHYAQLVAEFPPIKTRKH